MADETLINDAEVEALSAGLRTAVVTRAVNVGLCKDVIVNEDVHVFFETGKRPSRGVTWSSAVNPSSKVKLRGASMVVRSYERRSTSCPLCRLDEVMGRGCGEKTRASTKVGRIGRRSKTCLSCRAPAQGCQTALEPTWRNSAATAMGEGGGLEVAR